MTSPYTIKVLKNYAMIFSNIVVSFGSVHKIVGCCCCFFLHEIQVDSMYDLYKSVPIFFCFDFLS